MKNGGMGIGSSSILLIFTVLCLAVFAMISLSSSRTDKAMTDNWEKTVKEYYAADMLAEQVLADIVESDTVPDSLRGIEISSEPDVQAGARLVSYNCPVSGDKQLTVRLALRDGDYDILEWRMVKTGEWDTGGSTVLWLGD